MNLMNELKKDDHIIIVNKFSNIYHMFKVTGFVDDLTINAILVQSTSNIIDHLIGKQFILSEAYFEMGSSDFDCKLFKHKPTNAEIMAVML